MVVTQPIHASPHTTEDRNASSEPARRCRIRLELRIGVSPCCSKEARKAHHAKELQQYDNREEGNHRLGPGERPVSLQLGIQKRAGPGGEGIV